MREAPGAFEKAVKIPYQIEFGVLEEPESTEDNPVLRYERNGFVFIARLDVPKQTVDVYLETKRPESFEADAAIQQSEVQRLAEQEVIERWHEEGYFA